MVEFKSANLNTGNVLKITEGDTSSVSCDIYYYKIFTISLMSDIKDIQSKLGL